jgi:CubicO group peptidase (beta-lactamase class C family)
MDAWLQSASDYICDWLEFQLRATQQPGCIVAIARRGKIVTERAFGLASLDSGEKLTARHRFRIASHSKAFTAAGLMKLREQRKLRLDDPVGRYVSGLHPRVARATLAQLLSHSAGLTRDGANSGQFIDTRPYLDESELLAELKLPPPIEANTRFKYSNHGFALLGLVIERITGEPYAAWIKREIVEAAGLKETEPNVPIGKGVPFARGHSRVLPSSRRWVIPGENPAHAMASAAGFVSTAADTARFFAQLAPNASRSLLSVASRREMTRRHWRVIQSAELHYGLGLAGGKTADWTWFGHGGGFQGYISRTCVIPACDVAITLLTNAIDGGAPLWMDGALNILRAFRRRGAPSRRVRDWRARWWTVWRATDLVPMGNRVVAANPHLADPFMDAAEIHITGRDTGKIVVASGYDSFGEPVRRVRNKSGAVTDVWIAGAHIKPEKALAAEIERRYRGTKRTNGG